MPQITVYTVPNCADCEAVKRLLTSQGAAFAEQNVRDQWFVQSRWIKEASLR
ncbi:hypothetical protein DESA109040_21300 [Deinococcus saxicola]|uniref:glutaredoxin domain-containing protein n=1 Tax=Deinococcus saxicola TaxID=249406 RepID=UPI0039F0C85E